MCSLLVCHGALEECSPRTPPRRPASAPKTPAIVPPTDVDEEIDLWFTVVDEASSLYTDYNANEPT